MTHDESCELHTLFNGMTRCTFPECWAQNGHCHCGARRCPLCKGCRDGRHLNHAVIAEAVNVPCSCPLCEEDAA